MARISIGAVSDRDVLAKFFEATGGKKSLLKKDSAWVEQRGWKKGTPLKEWTGVTLDAENNRVEKLELIDNGCAGEICKELGNLSGLMELYLSGNALIREIPSALGKLSMLTHLSLRNNSLTGPIPPQLGNLSALTMLALSWNNLDGLIPARLGNLTMLERLELEENQLEGSIPTTFSKLTCLSTFSCDQLSGAPVDTESMDRWRSRLSQQHLREAGDQHVDQQENQISEEDATSDPMPGCKHDRDVLIQVFYATGGKERCVPGTGPWLNRAGWGTNQPLEDWHGVTLNAEGRVQKLDLHSNGCKGNIPANLAELSALTELVLHGNEFTGSIPPQLGQLTKLTVLDLDSNQLTGDLPPDLGNLLALTHLSLTGNRFTGNIPAALGRLSALKKLWLAMNLLSGPIPEALGGLAVLKDLWLSNNKLSGPIPPGLQSLSALKELALHNNELVGAIPPTLAKLSTLSTLYLQGNQLSGSIPEELGSVSTLTNLDVQDNKLSGALPSSFSRLPNLRSIKCKQLSGFTVSGGPEAGESVNTWRSRLQHQPAPNAAPVHDIITNPRPVAEGAPTRPEDPSLASGSLDATLSSAEGQPSPRSEAAGKGSEIEGLKELVEGVSRSRCASGSLLSTRNPVAGGRPRPRRSQTSGDLPGDLDTAKVANELSVGTLSGLEAFTEDAFRGEVDSSKELRMLSPENLQLVRRIMEASPGSSPGPGAGPSNKLKREGSLRALEGLVANAKILNDLVTSKIQDDDIRNRERALTPDSIEGAYYLTVRRGLCNAYLASSVIASDMVATSKTGAMTTAGNVFSVIAGATPVFGGLASLAVAGLDASGRYIQKKRVMKISTMAADSMECCSLAKMVAWRLTDASGYASKTARDGPRETGSKGASLVVGANTAYEGAVALQGGVDKAMDWFVERVAGCEPSSDSGATGSTPSAQAGRVAGKKHISKMLLAMEQGCIPDTSSVDPKVDALVRVVLGNTGKNVTSRPAPALEAPAHTITSPPLSPTRKEVHPEEEAALQQKLSDVMATVGATKSSVARLQSQMEEMETKKDAKGPTPVGVVDTGVRQVFAQAQRTEAEEGMCDQHEERAQDDMYRRLALLEDDATARRKKNATVQERPEGHKSQHLPGHERALRKELLP